MKIVVRIFLSSFLFSNFAREIRADESKSLMIGVVWERCNEGETKNVCHAVLTPGFERKSKWSVFNNDRNKTANVDWTIAFDGKTKGKLPHSVLTPSQWNAEYLVAKPGTKIDWVKGKFETWSGQTSHRPMVVSSQTQVTDPDLWKPFELSGNLRELAWNTLKEESADDFRKMGCQDPKKKCPVSIQKAKFGKAYRSKAGITLVEISVETNLEGEFEGTFKTLAKWFVVENDKITKTLFKSTKSKDDEEPENLWSESLVDAGDYSGEGHSQIIFWISGYNMNGIALFDSALNELGRYQFSFH